MKFELAPYYRNITEEELLNDLERVAKEVGNSNTLSKSEYEKYGKYSYDAVRRKFGSFKNALTKVGLQTARNWGTTNEEYFNNLKEVWTKLGRQPKYEEMRIPFSKLSGTAYLHKFGSWRKGLESFVVFVNNENIEVEVDTQDTLQREQPKLKSTNRQPNLRLRFLVMKRDNFKCVLCGRSPANDINVELEIDHIIAWSKGGETFFENLQTLCLDCNQGKSNLDL